ncbi:hypothetical protein ERJ75_001651800 [Trypanosoma vivax]|uniref:Uncharacterized protein n=1 Tax=Trypanosoma vivax (strain Y486) TaxID=1055687 RepID=G0U9J9_TRYVY|nr:hypothetical protein TRVL_02917 [Trypanosoma vivax]KAH8605042.1 hypothetical protein ERJ75_001651800 [Trypanosoma vivax]CCC54285.1 conserved hypothetical protein [Trypanosoma vivax Y486]
MLSRVIHDLYFLKRIHAVSLDEKLGQALKTRLAALDLAPGPSPGPAALRRLLECLVHFQLEHSPVTASAVALVKAELPHMTGLQLSRTVAACCMLGQNDISFSALPLLSDALPSMDSVGTVQLVESLATAGVRHEDTWSLLAEHCIRRMDSFNGQQLYRIIERFYERKVQYPDFYVVAERHICAQPSSYISMEHLSGVIECYRGLGMPVMSLLAASSTRSAEGFESALAAMTPARVKREHRVEGTASASLSSSTEASGNHAVITAFVQSTLKAVKVADCGQLNDMLQRCEARQLMHAEIMEAVGNRLLELHRTAPNVARTTALMRLAMRFEKPEWFTAAAIPFSQLLDECAESAIPVLGHRMLSLAAGALKLFPTDKQPTHFYYVLVRDLKFGDVAASVDSRRLLLVVGVVLALRAQGGPALLEQHMPMISVAAANAPLRVQVELAAMLAPLPAAKKSFLPDLFTSLCSQKNLARRLTARESIFLLKSLTRSRLPFNDLLFSVVEYTRLNPGRFDASELVSILHQCATLGFNDIEFYSAIATHILEMSANSTVHDLCRLMYTFTFVLKGVIRVVQQIVPRLRVSASQATVRDITLLLYSIVKLRINRHAEVTSPFCDRAVNVLGTFKGEELASCMSSLRVLKFYHERFTAAAAEVLGDNLRRRAARVEELSSEANSVSATCNEGVCVLLTTSQIISVANAIVVLQPALLRDEWQTPLQDICLSTLATASPMQIHLITGVLAALNSAAFTSSQRELLQERVDSVCDRFASGPVAAEVLLSLHDVMLREGMSEDKVKELLAASPLAVFAKDNMSSIMGNTEVRDRLRSKGLLTVLAGVSVSSTVAGAAHAPPELSLRESLLLHKKASQRSPSSVAEVFKRGKSGALKPTTAEGPTRTKKVVANTPMDNTTAVSFEEGHTDTSASTADFSAAEAGGTLNVCAHSHSAEESDDVVEEISV